MCTDGAAPIYIPARLELVELEQTTHSRTASPYLASVGNVLAESGYGGSLVTKLPSAICIAHFGGTDPTQI